jgi:hypothetical protein
VLIGERHVLIVMLVGHPIADAEDRALVRLADVGAHDDLSTIGQEPMPDRMGGHRILGGRGVLA